MDRIGIGGKAYAFGQLTAILGIGQEHAQHRPAGIHNRTTRVAFQCGKGETFHFGFTVQPLHIREAAKGQRGRAQNAAIGIAGNGHIGLQARRGALKGGDSHRGKPLRRAQHRDAKRRVAGGKFGVIDIFDGDLAAPLHGFGGGHDNARPVHEKARA